MKISRVLSLIAMSFAFAIGVESATAQPGGGGGGMGGGMGGPGGGMGGPGMMGMQSEVSIEATMGLFEIDKEAVIKRCKVKDDATKAKVTKLVNSYLIEMEDLKTELESTMPSKDSGGQRGQRGQRGQEGDDSSTQQERPSRDQMSSSDRSEMQAKMKARRETMAKFKERCTAMHETLKSGLKESLSEKQFKGWEKYYKGLCQDNYFGEYSMQQGQGEGQGGGMRGQGGGLGGPGGGMGGGMGGF